MVSHPAAQQHSMSQQPQPSRGVYHNPYSGANDYPPHLSTHHRHATPHHQRHESFHAQDAVVPQQHPSPQRAFPIQKIAEAASAKAVEVEAVTVARGMEVDDEEDEEDDGEITQGSKSNNQDSGTNHSRDIKNMAEDKQASMLAPENKSQRSGSISEDGQEIHKCSSCGKVYKHLNCLTKHRWEHSKYWKSATKFYLSKHQQVRMMEAAAILLGLDSGRNSDDDEIVGSVINGRIQSFGPSTTIPASRSPPSPPVRSHSGAGHDDESLVMLEKEMRPREKKPASLTKAQSMTDGDMAPMAVIMPKKEEDQQRTNLESATTTITAAAATTVVSPQAMSDAGSMSGSPPSLVPDDRSSTSSSMSSRSSQDDDTLMTEAAKLVDIGKSVPSSELTPKVAAPARGGYGHFQHQHHVTQGERYAPGPHYGHPSSPLMLNNNHHHPRYANHPHLSKSESYNPAPQPSPPGVASTRKPVYSSQELY
ncbi:hypothetical protein BGZ73_006207 [Actinomortierella ambigua]|nr:hypothetical protein BGZ73_006207 [Actinomortierella ambigua]